MRKLLVQTYFMAPKTCSIVQHVKERGYSEKDLAETLSRLLTLLHERNMITAMEIAGVIYEESVVEHAEFIKE